MGVILLLNEFSAVRIIQMLNIGNNITISEDQLSFVFSRSSGPGGQNVNKVNTRVTLLFDVKNCTELKPWQKGLIQRKLKTRINKEGVLRIIAQQSRTQAVNRKLAIERLQELLTEALKRMPPRKKTKMPRSVKRKRLNDKKYRSKTKQLRGKVEDE